MSDELADALPTGSNEPSTRDLVLQLVEQMNGLTGEVSTLSGRMERFERALGIGEPDTQPLSSRVNRLVAEVADIRDEMRSMRRFAFDAVGEMGRMHQDLDERLTLLEQRTPKP